LLEEKESQDAISGRRGGGGFIAAGGFMIAAGNRAGNSERSLLQESSDEVARSEQKGKQLSRQGKRGFLQEESLQENLQVPYRIQQDSQEANLDEAAILQESPQGSSPSKQDLQDANLDGQEVMQGRRGGGGTSSTSSFAISAGNRAGNSERALALLEQ